MTDKKLLESLSRLGLPLMETSEDLDVSRTLAEVVKSRDARLWEGFPVVLVNAARDYRFDYVQVYNNLASDEEKSDFHRLLLLSLALYDSAHLSFSWMNRLKERFTDEEKAQLKFLRSALARDELFDFGGMQFHPARLKGVFELYFQQEAGRSRQQKERYEDLSLEYALSQVFSPKQKELVRKKLDGLPLSKTEKEYYSRTVKKKVVALANAELHRLAQKLMEY
jgi:hypothetical protein